MTLSKRFSPDLAAAIARAGVDTSLEERDLQDAIRERRGYIDEWWVDHDG